MRRIICCSHCGETKRTVSIWTGMNLGKPLVCCYDERELSRA